MAKIIKAELWDKMQYLFRNYYDRMVHAVLYYDAPLDMDALTELLIWTTEKVPLLHSSFSANVVEPYWKVENYRIQDILTSKLDCTDLEMSIDDFITYEIPTNSNVQYRVKILSDGKKWAICILLNHMCMDGGDFKYFLNVFAENYNKRMNGDKSYKIKQGSRSYDAVYSKLTPQEKEIAKGLYKNISAVKDKHKFPFTPDSPIDKCMMNKCKISADKFTSFKNIGKNMGVTVNDIMLAFYINSIYELGNYDRSESLAIPCMVDLRRYIEDNEKTGLTNHTGFMICNVARCGDDVNDTLIEVLRTIRKSKDDPYMGLYSLPLLKFAYTVFPYIISETAIKIGYLNPLIGMSNIGILKPSELKLGEANLVDGWMTGGIKFKPYMQLAFTTLNNEVTMTIAIRGNDEDKKVVEKFFEIFHSNIDEFIKTNINRLTK